MMVNKKAVQFGAGNIGRGFLGQLLTSSGFSVVFVDIDKNLINLLELHKKYPIEIVSQPPQKIEVKNIRALHIDEKEKIADEIATSNIIISAVGNKAIRSVLETIAYGLIKRFKNNPSSFLNILICENLYDAASIFRKSLLEILPPHYEKYLYQKIGLVETVIGRMVPIMTKEEKEKEPLLIKVEAFCELPVDKNGFVGEIPKITHMVTADNFQSYVDRKLYTHNCGHAVCAYLGYLKHYRYIFQAVNDSWIREKVLKVMIDETGQALIKKHCLNPAKHQYYIMDLINRFGNEALGDTVFRVAKDPLRKLGHYDRLIGAANLCLAYNILPENIALAIAGALKYFDPADQESQKLQEMMENKGIDAVLQEICQIETNGKLGKLIKEWYFRQDKLYPFQ